jgi:hypothetical protein
MKVKVKKRNDPNEQLQPCAFIDLCFGACDWCETHDYSEACVPMLQERVNNQAMTIRAQQSVLDEIAKRSSSCKWCEDSAGMEVTVVSRLKDGIRSGIVGGNWTAEFCPFCGRKLEG